MAPARSVSCALWSALWRIARALVARSRVLDLRRADWLVAYRPCGCIAGAVSASAHSDAVIDFARDCEREGLRVEPRYGDVCAQPCATHRRSPLTAAVAAGR